MLKVWRERRGWRGCERKGEGVRGGGGGMGEVEKRGWRGCERGVRGGVSGGGGGM